MSAGSWLNRGMRRLLLAVCFGLACDVSEGIPEGKLAVVGPTAIGPEDIAVAHSQVGAYGQLRFSGPEGDATMLEALIATELMALEAREKGLAGDVRVGFAQEEEIASVYLSTLLERAVPRASVEADTEALRAFYDANPERFTVPEERSAQGVVFKSFAEADAALVALRGGMAELADFGDVFATPLQARDDLEFPASHPFLFADGVGEGDFIPHPLFLGESLLVGRVQTVKAAHLRPFDDPAVQEQLVEAVIAPRREAARAQVLERIRRGDAPL